MTPFRRIAASAQTLSRRMKWLLVSACMGLVMHVPADARVIELANGTEFQGLTDAVPTLGADVLAPASRHGDVKVELIVVIDDGLRRTFVSKYQVTNVRDEVETQERIRLPKQNVVKQGNVIGRIGDIVGITPFDKWGRRTFSTLSATRRLNIVQGITEVTPVWTRVQGLKSAKSYVWDMRIATSSIPRDKLREILASHLDENDPQVRLSIVLLYLQAERYGDAETELREAMRDFPELADLQNKLKELRQLRSKQQLDEIKLRQASGQHKLVANLLDRFPDEDVAGEILLEVSELAGEYAQQQKRGLELLTSLTAQIESVEQKSRRQTLDAFLREISAELNFNTLYRLADYQRLLPDKQLKDEQKLALALSGWLLDGQGIENLAVATSLWKARELVAEYLISDNTKRRQAIIAELASLDGGSPSYVAQILKAMKPPLRTPGLSDRLPDQDDQPAGDVIPTSGATARALPDAAEANNDRVAGMFSLQALGVAEGETIDYVVQLPPEYDANRRYPTIVTLHAAGSTPEMQIEWWAGGYDKDLRMRLGQAARHGYIVVAPKWASFRQQRYDYTAREHAAVLFSLRDATQRFSIDTDRVYLSGHSMGGDAAWDIGLAHPDLWAGVMPIAAVAEYDRDDSPKYVSRYWPNGKHVSFYFVGGAFDGDKIDVNARDWNRYLKRTGFNTTIVEYLGRGHEHFQGEIQRIFTWMSVHQRDFSPREFEVVTMRPWDRFYWWLEADDLPAGAMVHPAAWPPRGAIRPASIEGAVRDKKNVSVTTGAGKVTVWLSPDLVDLDGEVKIYLNGKLRREADLTPKTEVLLEDARTRGDRAHAFWVKVDLNKNRGPNRPRR